HPWRLAVARARGDDPDEDARRNTGALAGGRPVPARRRRPRRPGSCPVAVHRPCGRDRLAGLRAVLPGAGGFTADSRRRQDGLRVMALQDLFRLRTAAPKGIEADTLLVRSDLPGTMQLFRVPLGGGQLEQLTSFPDPVDGRFVPGTETILLEHDDAGNELTQLSLLEGRAGAEPRPLVSDPAFVHRDVSLSRDGSLLAYATNRDNGVDWAIYVRSLD